MKTLRNPLIWFTLFILIAGLAALAQGAAPVAPADAPDQVAGGLTDLIVRLAAAHPWIITVLALLGTLRLVVKPLMSGLHYWVLQTPSDADDKLLERVEHSWLYTGFLFLLDWLVSIKVKPKSGTPVARAFLFFFLLSAVCFYGTGCAGRTTAQVIRAMSKDPASVHIRVTTFYGTIELARTAPNTNSPAHSVGADGTISVK